MELTLKQLGGLKDKLLTLPGDPHVIAMGVAIGVFISFTPLIPFHMALSALLAMLLGGSKLAAMAGTYLSNPVTIPFQYFMAYKSGALIWRYPVDWHPHGMKLHELVSMGWRFATEMVTGGVINGVIPAVAAYFLTKTLIQARRNKTTAPETAPTA